jgi:heptosyltransferase-1
MQVLVVKTSSLGDVVHTLPALTDAVAAIPGIRFDWVVEEAFTEIPRWHPAVDQVFPLALRRWRRDWRKAWRHGEPRDFVRRLRSRSYERVIDAQGLLLKSGLVAALARGPCAGYDRRSARDPWVSWTYRRSHRVSRELHAVARIRRLFAAELGYAVPQAGPDYGIRRLGRPVDPGRPYLVFLHSTSWPSKHWPSMYWAELAHLARVQGYRVVFPWHSPEDRLSAERIIRGAQTGELLPRQGLTGLAGWLGCAAGVVGVDTGLAHLAAAVGVPAVTLFGPTRVDLTGAVGPRQRNLAAEFPCAPCLRRDCDFHGQTAVQPACFATLPPELVWQALQQQIQATE